MLAIISLFLLVLWALNELIKAPGMKEDTDTGEFIGWEEPKYKGIRDYIIKKFFLD